MNTTTIDMQNNNLKFVDVHFLPCTISQSGPALVEEFFIHKDNVASFHGRKLIGQKLDEKLLVFTKKDGQLILDSNSKDIYYWKWDEEVQDDDLIKQMFLFPKILDVMHQTIELE